MTNWHNHPTLLSITHCAFGFWNIVVIHYVLQKALFMISWQTVLIDVLGRQISALFGILCAQKVKRKRKKRKKKKIGGNAMRHSIIE